MSPSRNSAGTYESWAKDNSSCYSKRKNSKNEERYSKPAADDVTIYENLADLELKPKVEDSSYEVSKSSRISQDQTSSRQGKSKQSKIPKIKYREATSYTRGQSSEEEFLDEERELLDKLFLGALKERCVGKYLKVNEFRLYYKIPSPGDQLTPSLPLQIGYMSSDRKVHHFPVGCTNPGTRKQAWFVVTGGSKSQIVAFSTLPALLRYHQIYYYVNSKTGTVELFPV